MRETLVYDPTMAMASDHFTAPALLGADTRARTLTAPVAMVLVGGLAVGLIVVQQLVRTPWGLPGHRGLFWLSTLIAVRLIVDRPGTAVRVAATASCLILMSNPAMGVHVIPYLLAALLVDRAMATRTVRRHPWVILVLAPLIHLVAVLDPLVHNLQLAPLVTVLPGMGFYIRGDLLWGAAAGVVGLAIGLPGRGVMRRLTGESRPVGA